MWGSTWKFLRENLRLEVEFYKAIERLDAKSFDILTLGPQYAYKKRGRGCNRQ